MGTEEGRQPWEIFHSQEETGSPSVYFSFYKQIFIKQNYFLKIQGVLGSYDGSGYYYDFNKTTTKSQISEILGEMSKRSWFDGNMNALFLQINYFELTKKYFVTITQV